MTTGTGFSRIYVERKARAHPESERILTRLAGLPLVEIEDYQELFSRPRQSFSAQKRAPALVLAVKEGTFLYRGSERINSWQQSSVWYNDLIRNCVYDCEYCFLQGMHASAHAVINVNIEDYLAETRRALVREGRLYLSISYLTDLLGFEPITHYTQRWIEFARNIPNLEVEIRTKSDNWAALRGLAPSGNVVLVWSLSPVQVAATIEHGTASFANRLYSARNAIAQGYRVRLCFDPVVVGPGWEEQYRDCVAETFKRLPAGRIELVSVGGLRMGNDQFSRLRKDDPARSGLFSPVERRNGITCYRGEVEARIRQVVGGAIGAYMPPQRINFISGPQPASDETKQTAPAVKLTG